MFLDGILFESYSTENLHWEWLMAGVLKENTIDRVSGRFKVFPRQRESSMSENPSFHF